MSDPRKLRRQVAWLCFEPHLSQDECLDAIQILERGYQLDGTMNMISYISKVCNQFNIADDIRKSLYLKFHQLTTSPPQTAIDPATILLEREQNRLISARQPSTTAPSAEAAPLISTQPEQEILAVMAQPNPANRPTNDEPTPRKLPAHTVIFSLLLYQILELSKCSHNEFFDALKESALANIKQTETMLMLAVEWSANPNSFKWAYDVDETVLHQFVHVIYTCLCDLLGPVEADLCFHKALSSCEKRPEARQFSPAKFL